MPRLHPHLPIFHLRATDRSVLYAPGHLAVATAREVEMAREELAGQGPATELGAQLLTCAEQAVAAWRAQAEADFAPECLTLYLTDRCQLACPYCYAHPTRGRARHTLDEGAIRASAELVARHCAEKGKPFHLVLHGGGEPTQAWPQVQQAVAITRGVADRAGLDWFGYVATNGVMLEARARWLGAHFSLVGISCDGPPEIQDRQRPRADGNLSSPYVARTAQAITSAGGRFSIRATVTPETVERQTEIVRYLCEELGASQIRFEPVYGNGDGSPAFAPEQASWFVEHFLAAEQEARRHGCELSYSGVRLDEVHGPYCQVLRNVLHLTPGGAVSACFRCGDARQHPGLVVGRWTESEGLTLDQVRIAGLRRRAAAIPKHCQECVNCYHCARDCPEVCVLEAGPSSPGFRCLVARGLAEAWILGAVSAAPVRAEPLAVTDPVPRRIELAPRRLPLPVWARRGYEHDGGTAWQTASRLAAERSGPLSVYVHVPFCRRRCAFCDCYSVALPPSQQSRQEEFAAALTRELRAWAQLSQLAHRPVTTVHFGGGTPNCLDRDLFADLVAALRAHLGVSDETELALESTSSLLDDDHLRWLRRLGFRRLHVGVQTLEDDVRRRIGRREASEVVATKLERALALGFITSVDVVYGLPGQTLAGLTDTIARLVSMGVDGCSLYQLQVSARNQRFLARHGAAERDPNTDYALLAAAERELRGHGYRQTHFTHFAGPRDTNLYYAHPLRGEDLLALGPTADGVFGSYHYRHPSLEEYLARALAEEVVLEGGVWESEEERRVLPASLALISGAITREALAELDAEVLGEQWLAEGLLQEEGPGRLALTALGSWCIAEMLDELSSWAATDRAVAMR